MKNIKMYKLYPTGTSLPLDGHGEDGVVSPSHVVLANDTELSYIGHDSPCIPQALGRKYGAVTKRLDLSYNCIRTLRGLERFPFLSELVLDNNELTDSIEFPPSESLTVLSLNKNKIENLDDLLVKLRRAYRNLRYLSILGNRACPDQLTSSDKDDADYQRYRFYVIHYLPKLKFLDSKAITTKEWKEAQRVGSYMKVIRPKVSYNGSRQQETDDMDSYSPLPQNSLPNGIHTGIYGMCRYKYSGKHSEGNRFIRNNDL